MFEEFIKSPAGRAVIGTVIALLAIAVIELNYKLFFKRVLDFVFAAVFIVVLSPLLAVCAVISKKNSGEVFAFTAYPGKKGKIIYVRSFAGIDGKLKNLPQIIDVLYGNMSFVGIKLISMSDGAFMEDAAMERFNARPGIFNHLAIGGNEELTYEQAFEMDKRYSKRRELFRDIFTVIICALYALRGDGKSYMGETANKSYAQVLIERGEITAVDLQKAEQSAAKAVENDVKAKNFKKQKRL